MKIRIKIKKKLEEISAMGGGDGAGFAGTAASPPKHPDDLPDGGLVETFSTQGIQGGITISLSSGEAHHWGHVQRSKAQGLRNVMEEEQEEVTKDEKLQEIQQFRKKMLRNLQK
jgi:hypothetical protein|tara:strand:+ start:1808 stop:2149 length:342 start_codon:yes stop_codon:yes gene_type:complete